MASRIGIISPIKKTVNPDAGYSLAASLSKEGMTKWPTCGVTLFPHKENDGSRRTGLDENALYIKQMGNTKEAEAEKTFVKAKREELEALTGLDLGPKSPYYTQMMDDENNTVTRAKMVKLIDGENKFNLSDPYEAITYYWLRVYPTIAPSYQVWQKGVKSSRCPQPAKCSYYVQDEEFESEILYEQKTLVARAVSQIFDMSPERQLKVATLLGLPVGPNTKPSMVYNQLDSFVQEATKGSKKNIDLFNSIYQMADEHINLRYMIKEALTYNVYRKVQLAIYEGDNKIGKDEADVIKFLSDPKNQEDYLALEEKIKSKKLIEVS